MKAGWSTIYQQYSITQPLIKKKLGKNNDNENELTFNHFKTNFWKFCWIFFNKLMYCKSISFKTLKQYLRGSVKLYRISYRSHKSNWNKLHYFFSFVFILHQRKKNKTEWKHMFWSCNSLTTDVKVPKIFSPCCWLSTTHIYQTLTTIPQHVHRKAKHVCKHRRKSNAQST